MTLYTSHEVSAPNGTTVISEQKSRIIGLDIMRCAAILLVVFSHGLYLFFSDIPPFIANNLIDMGNIGVQIFFVLSGFLIGSILLNELSKGDFGLKSLINFWKRRWFRTLPNFYLFLAIYYLLAVFSSHNFLQSREWGSIFTYYSVNDVIRTALFIQSLFKSPSWGPYSFMAHSWSLAVEEWFYISLPLMLSILVRSFNVLVLKQKIIGSLVFLLAGFTVVRFLGLSGRIGNYSHLSVIYNFDHMIFGVIAAWLFRYHRAQMIKNKNALFVVAIAFFVSSILLSNVFVLTGSPNVMWYLAILPLQSIAFALSIPWFHQLRLDRNLVLKKAIIELSIASYSTYLLHFIVLVYFVDTIKSKIGFDGIGISIGLFFTYIIVSLVLSSINYRLFERKMTSLRDKYSYK